MRLLFLNANRSPAFGGVERWMIDTAVGLAPRGYASTVLGRPDTPWLRAARRAGLHVRSDIRGTWAQRVLRVRAVMRETRPDVVIAKGKKAARMAAFGRSTGAGGRVALFLGATHELDAARWVDRFTWRVVDGGIVVAHGMADWYAARGFGPAARLHVLWKGLDHEGFAVAARDGTRVRAALGLGAREIVVGTVGRLAWQKGIDDLLAAVRLVLPAVPRARFLVVGGGRDAEAISAAVRDPPLAQAVTLLGPRDDVPALLGAMDIVVQSSRREGMAQTTLEAMAAGRPVVSTATIGAAEAIEDGVSGLIVPVGDPRAMADHIIALARDPDRRRALADAAQARIATHFTEAHGLARCEDVVRRLAQSLAASSRTSA